MVCEGGSQQCEGHGYVGLSRLSWSMRFLHVLRNHDLCYISRMFRP